MVIVLRWVDNQLEVHEEFLGLYEVENIESKSLVRVVKDCLLRHNISITKMRGQCYDGASNMTGSRNGVSTVILEQQPTAFYTHCYGHSLNLAVSDTMKHSQTMKRALDTTCEVTKLIKDSPRRDSLFRKMKEDITPGNPGIRVLCPTRWTVRADSMKSILSNYSVLQDLWEEAVSLVHNTEMIARIRGVASQMELFEFFFGLVLSENLLRSTDNLSKTLQKKELSAAVGQTVAKKVTKVLKSMRTEDNFSAFWEIVLSKQSNVDVNDPVLPRRRKTPKRFEQGEAPPEYDLTPKDMYKRKYYEALDLLLQAIDTRFNQPGYRAYCCLQNLLLQVFKEKDYSEEMKKVLEIYGDDLSEANLADQFRTLVANFSGEVSDITDVIKYLRNLSPAEKQLMYQVIIVTKLLLVMPATNSTSERSFSCMRRVKTYLRSTMTQQRLNNLMVLHVHKDHTDKLNLCEVANEFVSVNERRQEVFGTF